MDCLVVDYGSQYTNLIGKRLDEMGVDYKIVPWSNADYLMPEAKAIILSGSHWSVNDAGSPRLILSLIGNKPVLGICYGMQLLAKQFGGNVTSAATREYGNTIIYNCKSALVDDNVEKFDVWMSHGDYVSKLPTGFEASAFTEDGIAAMMESDDLKIFGMQFHPEVTQTERGMDMIRKFITEYTSIKCSHGDVRSKVVALPFDVTHSTKPIVCAISGGIDSLVAYKALSEQVSEHRLLPVTIDTGLLRQGEIESFSGYFDDLIVIDASDRFFAALRGVTDPEAKRAAIGKQFVKELKHICDVQDTEWLVQGTIYTDIIESSGMNGTATTIKSHHNVGGMPKDHGLAIIEPLSKMYKDDVRKLAMSYDIPGNLVWRKPFPGPGLAIRIIGEVTKERVRTLRRADNIVTSRLEGDDPWQVFCVMLPDVRSVGVKGDARSYDATLVIRSVDSIDGMTASVHHHDMHTLTDVADELVNRVPGIGRVVFDLTSKPPGTIEWE